MNMVDISWRTHALIGLTVFSTKGVQRTMGTDEHRWITQVRVSRGNAWVRACCKEQRQKRMNINNSFTEISFRGFKEMTHFTQRVFSLARVQQWHISKTNFVKLTFHLPDQYNDADCRNHY